MLITATSSVTNRSPVVQSNNSSCTTTSSGQFYKLPVLNHVVSSLSTSTTGNIIAIGSNSDDTAFRNSGRVRVYLYKEGTNEWILLGKPIDGKVTNEELGFSVSLSGNGLTVAVGSRYHNGNDNDGGLLIRSGGVSMYDFDMKDNLWRQRGGTIHGALSEDQMGYSVSLSLDGSTVAIGAPGNSANGLIEQGHTRIYQYNNTQERQEWIQLGTIDGEGSYDLSGFSVGLSGDDPPTFIIGAPDNNEISINSGHARVYRYHEDTKSFVQLGNDLDGEMYYESAGASVSINQYGNIVAVGSTGNPDDDENLGNVKVYIFDETKNTWNQRGNDLNIQQTLGDDTGHIVSLSLNGDRVVIGGGIDANGYGYVQVYSYDIVNQRWNQTGQDLDSGENEYYGRRVTLSGDGNTVLVGSYYNDGVDVYRMCQSSTSSSPVKPECQDDKAFQFERRGRKKSCRWISFIVKKKQNRAKKICKRNMNIALNCEKSCGICN